MVPAKWVGQLMCNKSSSAVIIVAVGLDKLRQAKRSRPAFVTLKLFAGKVQAIDSSFMKINENVSANFKPLQNLEEWEDFLKTLPRNAGFPGG